MNLKKVILALVFFFSQINNIDATIKHIFIDINALIATNTSAAAKVVGIINSMKYAAKVGHIPSKSDLFKALSNVPSESTEITWNEDLVAPTILSDWLLGLRSNSSIHYAITHYLNHSRLSDIEKTIFKNITSMMMTPTMFIETQLVLKDVAKIISLLKKAGYKVYIIGNWDAESQPYLFKLLHGNSLPDSRSCYFSNQAKLLKPSTKYFDCLLEHFNITNKQECLIIDVEKHHVQGARNAGLNAILFHGHNPVQLKSELNRTGIRL